MKNFGLIGAAGFVAPRHMAAIKDTHNRLLAAVDPNDSVGILDSYFPDAHFFTDFVDFTRFVKDWQQQTPDDPITHVSICTPNHLHEGHIQAVLAAGADAICEKPLVLDPAALARLQHCEADSGRRVYTVLQLRLHPVIQRIQQQFASQPAPQRADVCLTYITRRGRWYQSSWKANEAHSGGVATNIGIHFFDMLLWIFGPVTRNTVHLAESHRRMAGVLELERARVRWFLSIDGSDLPPGYLEHERYAFRSIQIDGGEIEFTSGFTDLHTQVYADILAGGGFGIEDARPSVEIAHAIRQAEITTDRSFAHPYLADR